MPREAQSASLVQHPSTNQHTEQQPVQLALLAAAARASQHIPVHLALTARVAPFDGAQLEHLGTVLTLQLLRAMAFVRCTTFAQRAPRPRMCVPKEPLVTRVG